MSFREARKRAGLSVAQVMEALSVSDAAVYWWETGVTRPTAKRLLEVAKLYGTRALCAGWRSNLSNRRSVHV